MATGKKRVRSSVVKYINQRGHFPWIEQPDEFRRIMMKFLGSK